MTEEPRHRQNKNAVREEVQSFREVAQMSARGALATHSWNNLRSEIYFKAALGTVSAAATVWFVGGFAYGSETESWKGITCALTSLVCTKSLFSSSSKMKLWRKKNKAPPAARKTSAASVDDVSAAAPNSQSSQEITSARRASEGSSHSPPTRTADQ